jgi:hypothetical protein
MHSAKCQAWTTTSTTATATATATASHLLEFSDAGDLHRRAQAPVHVVEWKVRGLPPATAATAAADRATDHTAGMRGR